MAREFDEGHISNPDGLAKEVNEVLIYFKYFINPLIQNNILMQSEPIHINHIYNSSWRKHQFIHFLVFGGLHRDAIIQRTLKNLIQDLKFCQEPVAA